MKLYDNQRAPNPRRVRIFLAEKEMTVPSVQVDLLAREQKSEDFRRKNSLGSIPVLELDDGECIAESVAICRWRSSSPSLRSLGVTPESAPGLRCGTAGSSWASSCPWDKCGFMARPTRRSS